MSMGERLTRKTNSEARESISFSNSTTSAVADSILNENQKLWEYICQKNNPNARVNLNLIEILTQELRPDFDIHIEKRKSSGNFQQSDKEISNNKNDNEKDENKNKSSKFDSKYSPGRKKSSIQNSKIKYSPSKRTNSSNFKRITRSLGKRVLLKEFERTLVPEMQFNPCCMSTPIGTHEKIGNVIASDNALETLDESSFPLNKNDAERSNLSIDKGKQLSDHHNLNKNETILSQSSMEISSRFIEKNKVTNKAGKCFVRITRSAKQNNNNKQKKQVNECNESESKQKNKKNAEHVETNNQNNNFTVISSTPEGSNEKNNDVSIDKSILIIPETQEQQQKEKTLIYDKEISISESFTTGENCDDEIEIKNENLEENDENLRQNDENLCISMNNPNKDKSKEIGVPSNIGIVDVMNDGNDEIIDVKEEMIDFIYSNFLENSLSNENEASPSKQRRTCGTTRTSSNTQSSNVNNPQIENEKQNEDICGNNELEIEENTEKNIENASAREQRWIVTKIENSSGNSYNISKINTKTSTSIRKTNRTSKIPQIKRTGNLTSMKPLTTTTTPFKISEVSDQNELPVIVSVQSLGPNMNSKNQSNLNKDNINERFNRNDLSSRLDKIIDAVQNSIVPKSPVVIMIDNNRNKNNDSTKSQSNDIGNFILPMPPPEFSDSYSNKSKNNSASLKITNCSSKNSQRNKTNYDNVNMALISEDESDEPLAELDNNADKITDDSLPIQNNMSEKETHIFKKPVVNASLNKRKTVSKANENIPTPTKSNVIDYSLKVEKLKSLNKTPDNNSKIYLAENFSVQPVDLRKPNCRRSSILAQYKIKAINELKSMRKNTSEEDFNKALEEYKIKYNSNCSKLRKSISKLYPQENEENTQTKSDVPLVNVFRENEYYQSFTEVLNKIDRKSRERKNSISNLPAPPSFLLHSDINQTEELIEQNSELSPLRLREQESRKNSTFPNPPSFLLTDQNDLTLPINEPNNIIRPKSISSSNKRLSRFYQYQVKNEKNKNKRSVSATDTFNSNHQIIYSEPEIQHEPAEFSNALNRKSNNTQEFPLPPAEAYDRPNAIVIDIPQNKESSGYISAYFPANKRKKSVKNRCNRNGESSSSSDSPEPKRVFRKQYRSIKKAKSMPSLKPKFSDESQKEKNSGGDSSVSSTSTAMSQIFVDIQQQQINDSDHVYDEPEVITHLWKESIRKKSDESKKQDLIKNKRGRPKKQQNIDTLKETYLNITKNLPSKNLTLSFNKSSDGHRRKLYEKGKSDNEEAIIQNQKENTSQNIETESSFINDVSNNKSYKQQKASSIFSNVKQSVNINSNDDDAIFKKPVLPAPKLKKNALTKKTQKSSSKNDTDKENASTTKNIIRNDQNSTRYSHKTEAQRLLENLPRSLKMSLNSHEDDESTLSSNVRKSSRKPAPRRIYKYSTNEYEILPSMIEYEKMMKDFYNYPANKKQQKHEKKSERRLASKNNLKDNENNNEKVRVTKPKKKKIINEIIRADQQQENDLNNQNKVSSDFVEGVEIQNTNIFAEKQNNNKPITSKPKPKSKIKKNGISLMNEEHNTLNNSLVMSNGKDISQLVDTLKVSFNKFETTVLANLGPKKNTNAQRENISNENKNTVKTLNNEKLNSKKASKLRGRKNTLKEIATKQNDDQNSNTITENDSNSNSSSEQLTKSSSTESYDLFHWVKKLACASTKMGNNNKNKSKDDDDIQRYFAENSFRITDISKMEISEKNGVQYAFYKEERSKDFGYIKFKPGSEKPRIKSKTFDLHFLFMFGVLEFHIDGEVYNSKAGNFVSIPKGTYYSIVNNSSEGACLFFIKH